MRHKMNRIQSKNHNMGTYETKKVSISCHDKGKYTWYTIGYHVFINLHVNNTKRKWFNRVYTIYCNFWSK